MEVPRFWREMPVNVAFSGEQKDGFTPGVSYFKYPGGAVLLSDSYEETYRRFEDKGFKSEAIEKILYDLFGAVATEATISFEKLVNGKNELVGSEVREESGGEVKFGVDRLPRKVTRKTLFPSGADN